MWILPLVGYLGVTLAFGFSTVAIASALYYLSELVEEYTVIAKRLLTRMIYGVIGIHILLCVVDRFPFWLSLLGIGSHIVYLGNMSRFPVVNISSPLFIASCGLVIVNHWLWFRQFANFTPTKAPQTIYDKLDIPTFTQVAAYFGICVWLTPFALFVSLSASDHVLPTMASETPGEMPGSGGTKQKRHSMVKVVVDNFRGMVKKAGNVTGWWRSDRDSEF